MNQAARLVPWVGGHVPVPAGSFIATGELAA